MVAPVHARLRIGGPIFNDASWSIGVAFALSNGTDPFMNGTPSVTAALQAWADNVKALNGANIFPAAIRAAMSNQVAVDFIRASRIGLDGKESDVALIQMPIPVLGTGQDFHPAQTAVVGSLQTGRPGASYRGRVYLPATGLRPAQGKLSGDQTGGIASGLGQWLYAVAGAAQSFGGVLPFDIVPVVASNTKGALTRVTSVRVGSRLDSQRRRAESEEEVYSVAPVAA